MLLAFRFVFLCAIVLCLAAAVLVTASLFIADRAPQSAQFLGISIAVSGAFLSLGMLLLGIERHVLGIARWTRRSGGPLPLDFRNHFLRLLIYLSLGGAGLCAILAILTYAILARIDQGFAVFG